MVLSAGAALGFADSTSALSPPRAPLSLGKGEDLFAPEGQTRNPKPSALNSKPRTRNHSPQPQALAPQILNPQLETLSPKPSTPNHQP